MCQAEFEEAVPDAIRRLVGRHHHGALLFFLLIRNNGYSVIDLLS